MCYYNMPFSVTDVLQLYWKPPKTNPQRTKKPRNVQKSGNTPVVARGTTTLVVPHVLFLHLIEIRLKYVTLSDYLHSK